MIPNYVKPQLTIEQLLAELPSASTDRMLALVMGPQYLLSRYGKETTVTNEAFDAGGNDISYTYYDSDGIEQSLPSTHTVDLNSVRLHGKDLEAQLADFTQDGGEFKIKSTSASNVIKIASGSVKGSGTLDTLFRGREVEVGDIVYTSETDDSVDATTKRRTVIGFEGTDVIATVSDGTNSPYNPVTDASADATATVTAPSGWAITTSGTLDVNVEGGSILSGKLGEEYTLTVNTSGAPATATVDISSKSGDYSATNVATVNDSGNFQITDASLSGLTVTLDPPDGTTTLTQGDVYTFRAYQAYERLATTGVSKNITVSGTYTGTRDTTYIVTVKTGTAVSGDTSTAAVLSITDSAGVDTPKEVTVTDDSAFTLGAYGISMKIEIETNTVAQGGLRAGDVYSVACTAATASTTDFDKIILSGPAVDTTTFVDAATAIRVQFRKAFTGEILATDAADEEAWTADADSVTMDSGLALYMSDRDSSYQWVPYVDTVGKIHLSYRAAVPAPASEDKIAINTVSDITDNLGTIDMDNELAFGANEMLSGSQGKRIYALRTAGAALADFTAALRKIESTDSIYAIAPLTTTLSIQQAVASHCESMSSKTKKNFRRCYVGTDSPGSYGVLTLKSDLTTYTATVGDYGGSNVLLTTTEDVDFTTMGLDTGDLVKLTATSEEYEIDSVLSATEIILASGPDSPISPAVPFQLWRANTAASQVDYIQDVSSAIGSRRAVNVWVENGTRLIDGATTVIPNRFVACEVAGLRCSILPQQGLTYTEIQSITDAAAMFVKYNDDDLDAIAAAGTFIITQEAESGSIFIRHQLTTKSSGGSLYYEDSVGVNLDNISFKVKDSMQAYIGKKNVTAKTLQEIERDVVTILTNSTQTPADATYSPALNGFSGLTVSVHETLKDRVIVYGKLLMPLPLNNIEVTLEADVDFTL